MGSNQPEKFGYLCRIWLGAVNVCFSQKRPFKTLADYKNEGPLTAKSGHSRKRLNCRPLRRDINSSWFGCTKQLP